MRRFTQKRSRILEPEDGFTLSEMLVTMVVLGILFAMFATVISSAVRHAGEAEDSATQQAEVRQAIDRFEKEVRQAYSGDKATYPMTAFSGTAITVLSPDGVSPFHLRRVYYRLSGGEFQRSVWTSSDTDGSPWVYPGSQSAWHTLVSNVRNATVFQGFTASGAATSTASSIKTIKVTLTVSVAVNTTRQFTYTTNATLRNDL
jgi:prepilin-type N-terminal cleavage/methylation domain-containing protein